MFFPFFYPRLLIFAANFRTGMKLHNVKSLLVACFSVLFLGFSNISFANDQPEGGHHEAKEEKFDAAKVIMEHIMDAHEFHFFSIGDFHAIIHLPVIIYSPQRGLATFSSSHFGHGGHEVHEGYRLVGNKIIPVKEDGVTKDESVKMIDLSLTRNVIQMLIALIVLVIIMIGMARKYQREGSGKAPSGLQNAIEPVITFVRDEVAKPNLGRKYLKYLPYLLTIFFFILINNIFGLIPGSANVTGNMAFTLVLAVISLLVILFSSNGHFWGHIFWPPGVPFVIKIILVPVEFAGIFIKPIALMIRLFANMVAGHIIILSFISLIFIFGAMSTIAGWGFSPFSILFTVFIYFIEILVAFIQAFIFTNLTAVFIGQAFEGGHDDVDHHADPVVI